MGVYRTLILGRNIVAVNASSLSDLRKFYQHAEKTGEPMPIALALGVEPALQMAASCKLPPDQSELDLAGALQGKAIDMVKCETSDLMVPANAEMIIEGRVDFSRKIENTLGEFAGQYGPETAPVTEITAITHRRDAMFYSILAGKNPEHNTLGSIATFAIQRALAGALRKQLPAIRDINVYLDPKFGSMAHIVISIAKQNDAEPDGSDGGGLQGRRRLLPRQPHHQAHRRGRRRRERARPRTTSSGPSGPASPTPASSG